jgi:alpha-beta hydrolase superfamily lysophospholipase
MIKDRRVEKQKIDAFIARRGVTKCPTLPHYGDTLVHELLKEVPAAMDPAWGDIDARKVERKRPKRAHYLTDTGLQRPPVTRPNPDTVE